MYGPQLTRHSRAGLQVVPTDRLCLAHGGYQPRANRSNPGRSFPSISGNAKLKGKTVLLCVSQSVEFLRISEAGTVR